MSGFGWAASLGSTLAARRLRPALWLGAACCAVALACHRQTPERLIQDAMAARQQGDLLTAEVKFETFLEKYPDHEWSQQARLLLAECYFKDREFTKCLDLLQTIKQRAGGVNDQWGFQASGMIMEAYLQQNRPELALHEALETSRSLSPDVPIEGRFTLLLKAASIYRAAGDGDQARAVLRQAMAMDLGMNEIFVRAPQALALEYINDGQTTEGLRVFADYLREHPDSILKPQLLYDWGRLEKEHGDPQTAEALMDQSEEAYQERIAKTEEPSVRGELLMELALRQLARNKGEAARQTLARVMEDHPDLRLQAQDLIMRSYVAQGLYDEAERVIQQVIVENPNSPVSFAAQNALQQVYALRAEAAASGTLTRNEPTTAPAPLAAPTRDTVTTGGAAEARVP